MAPDPIFTPDGRETAIPRITRLGLFAVLLASGNMLALLSTSTLWSAPRYYVVLVTAVAMWSVVVAAYCLYRLRVTAARAMERLDRLAILDEASGVFSSIYLKMKDEEEQERVNRHGGSTSLLYIDLYGLDLVLEKLGKEDAAQTLEGVCGVMVANLRRCDVFGRIGGNEFLALLPATDRKQARLVAERLHRKVEEYALICGEGTVDFLRITTGVAGYPSNGDTMDNVVAAACAAMKNAREKGVNNIVVSEEFIQSDPTTHPLLTDVRGTKGTEVPHIP